MRIATVVTVVALVVCSLAMAADTDAKVEALKTKYDKQMRQLEQELQTELDNLKKAQQSQEPAKWYDNIMVNGYFQTRYHYRDYDQAITEIDDFEMRRLYVNLIAPVNQKTQAVITWAGVGPNYDTGANLSSETDWANVFVDCNLSPEWKVRMGQAPTLFGLETMEGSAGRLSPERWMAGEGTAVLPGLYVFGPWDRGLWIMNDQRALSDDGTGLRAAFSVQNGNFRSDDNNNDKTLGVDVDYFGKGGQYGASWLDGEFTFGGATNPREAVSVYARVYPGTIAQGVGFQAEFIDGEWMGNDKDGYYLQASRKLKTDDTVYLRAEEFDPDTDTADNEYQGVRLGIVREITPKDKLTCEYTLGEVDTVNVNELTLQYQRAF